MVLVLRFIQNIGLYDETVIDERLEADAIDAAEAGFMQGYNSA